MAIDIKNLSVGTAHTVLSVAPGTDVKVDGVWIGECVIAFEERDHQGFAEAFGLHPDTPPELIVEALKALKQNPGNPEATLEGLGIWQYIKLSAEGVAVVQALAQFASGAANLIGLP